MLVARQIHVGFLRPLVMAGLVGVAFVAARAGEKVDFSSQKGKVDLPSANLKNQEQFKPFDFLNRPHLGDKGGGPEVPPSLIPSTSLRGRQLERVEKYLDQERNWIFLSPESFSTPSTPEQAFGVQDASAGGLNEKPKTALERYWARAGRDSQSTSNRVTGGTTSGESNSDGDLPALPPIGQDDGDDAKAPGNPPLNSLAGQLRPGDDLGRPPTDVGFDRLFVPNWALGSSLSPSPGPTSPAANLTPAQWQARDDAFRNSLLSPGAESPAAGINNPLGFPTESARQLISPPGAQGSADSLQGPSTFGQVPGASAVGILHQSGAFGGFATPTLGPSSLAPAFAVPRIEPALVQPKPLVLDVPRPRF